MTTDDTAPFGINPATPSYLDRSSAEYDLAACMDRHPAGRDLPRSWDRATNVYNVTATWTPTGLRLAYWRANEITTLLLDEAAQQALRDALGVAR